jgi:hypothetical protein
MRSNGCSSATAPHCDRPLRSDQPRRRPPPRRQRWLRRWGGDEDQALGRSRATGDALGNPTGCTLTGGQAADLVGADALVPSITAPTVIADKDDDAEARVLAPLREASKATIIPPKRNRNDQRASDCHRYRARHPIEMA